MDRGNLCPRELAGGSRNVAVDLLESGRRGTREIALVADREVSYGSLLSHSSALASRLSSLGIQRGDRVVIAAQSTVGHVAAWYAILGLGAISIDLNYLLGDEEWRHILDNCSPKVVVAEQAFASRLRSVADPNTIFMGFEVPPEEVSEWSPCPISETDPAVIAYTSGTTGLPKGVVHTHGSINAQLSLLEQEVGYDKTWVIYQSIPLFSLHGFLPQIAIAVQVGETAILADKFETTAFARSSRHYPIAYTALSLPMVPRLIAQSMEGDLDLSHIKVLSCGGAPLHPQVSSEFRRMTGVSLTQGYGMTELRGAFVMDLGGEAPWGASGRCYPRTSDVLCIVDDAGTILDADRVGEIAIDAEFVTQRYWPDHKVELLNDRWFRTGDIGRVDEKDFVYLLDRKKDVVIRGGFNIYTAEIERVLTSYEWVEEVTVVGIPDERVGEVPIAFVVVKVGAPAAIGDQLLADVAARLGRLKRPEALHVADYGDLPSNALGKVQKSILKERAANALPA